MKKQTFVSTSIAKNALKKAELAALKGGAAHTCRPAGYMGSGNTCSCGATIRQ